MNPGIFQNKETKEWVVVTTLKNGIVFFDYLSAARDFDKQRVEKKAEQDYPEFDRTHRLILKHEEEELLWIAEKLKPSKELPK
jgi:hypothetical protein